MADIIEMKDEKEPILVPTSEIDRKATELKDRSALPKKPGDKVTFSELGQWIKIVPNELLEKVMAYVYRVAPIINRQQVDPNADNNIDVISGDDLRQFTEDYVREHHGGGTYMIAVSDLTVTGSGTRKGQSFKCYLTIPTIDCPPILDLREVDWTADKNKGYKAWARAKRLINENDMPVEIEKEKVKNSMDGDSMVSMLKVMTEFVGKMNNNDQLELKRKLAGDEGVGKGVMEILLEKMKQDDPTKQVNAMGTIITAMKGLMPDVKGDGGVVALIVPLMQMMMESNKQQTAILIKIIENQNSSKDDGGSKLSDEERLLKLIEISKAIKGQSPGPEKSMPEMIIEGVTTLAAPALELVNNIMRAKQMGMAGMPGQPMQQNPQPLNTSPKGLTPPSNNGQVPNQTPPSVSPTEATTIITQFGPLIIKHLASEGWEFADLVSNMFGDDVTASAVRHGVDGLLNAAKGIPQFWQQIETTYGEAHLRKWLDSFCNYREIIKKMEEEELEESKKDEGELEVS